MLFEPGYIVVTEDGQRQGSFDENVPLPAAGDRLILRHPDDHGPSWEVVRREFVNAQVILVVVREVDGSAAESSRDWTD